MQSQEFGMVVQYSNHPWPDPDCTTSCIQWPLPKHSHSRLTTHVQGIWTNQYCGYKPLPPALQRRQELVGILWRFRRPSLPFIYFINPLVTPLKSPAVYAFSYNYSNDLMSEHQVVMWKTMWVNFQALTGIIEKSSASDCLSFLKGYISENMIL